MTKSIKLSYIINLFITVIIIVMTFLYFQLVNNTTFEDFEGIGFAVYGVLLIIYTVSAIVLSITIFFISLISELILKAIKKWVYIMHIALFILYIISFILGFIIALDLSEVKIIMITQLIGYITLTLISILPIVFNVIHLHHLNL